MKYHLHDLEEERYGNYDFKEYTIEKLKDFFNPQNTCSPEDFIELYSEEDLKKFKKIVDIYDLIEWLHQMYNGMEVPYTFERVVE